MIGAQAIVGDIVSPRDRGRYMGLFGAVFGVATVLGPLLGGFFVEYLSWRWVFYINIPIGVVALFVTAAQLPGALQRVHHVIDYLGTILLTLATTALVLFTSLGGTTYRWGSAPIIALAVGGVALMILFLVVERRAAEPVIPLGLFTNRVFSAAERGGLRHGVRHVRGTHLPAHLLPGRPRPQPPGIGTTAPAADGRAAARLDRSGPAGEPVGPLQGVPRRRHVPDGRRVCCSCRGSGSPPAPGSSPATCSCSVSVWAWSCRSWWWRCRTPSPTSSWARPPRGRRSSA